MRLLKLYFPGLIVDTVGNFFVMGLFFADGTCGVYKWQYTAKPKNRPNPCTYLRTSYSWAIANSNLKYLNKAKQILEENLLKLENSYGKPAQVGYDLSIMSVNKVGNSMVDSKIGKILKDIDDSEQNEEIKSLEKIMGAQFLRALLLEDFCLNGEVVSANITSADPSSAGSRPSRCRR